MIRYADVSSRRKFPIYMLAQVLGAACASLVVYANYKSAIDVFEGTCSRLTSANIVKHADHDIIKAALASAQSHRQPMPPQAYSAHILSHS